jgi:hypothetical protein
MRRLGSDYVVGMFTISEGYEGFKQTNTDCTNQILPFFQTRGGQKRLVIDVPKYVNKLELERPMPP